MSTEAGPGEARTLRKGSIGTTAMVFFILASTAPLTAMSANFAVSLVNGPGAGTLGWIVAIGGLLTLYVVGFLLMARTVINAGAYFAFITLGLGPRIGSAAAMVGTVGLNTAAAAMVATTGYFTSMLLSIALSVEVPWWLISAVVGVVVYLLGQRGLAMASKLTIAASLIQFALLLALCASVFMQRGDAVSLDGLHPTSMLDDGFGLAIVFCILSFASFENAAAFGEEANAPRRSIARATYIVLIALVGIYLISNLALVSAFDNLPESANGDPGSLMITAAAIYLGDWAPTVMLAWVVLSFLAAAVAFHNMAARYHFALARAGLFPSAVAAIHPKHASPYIGSRIQSVITLAILLPFALAGLDPLSRFLPIVGGVTSLSVISVMAFCCASIIVAQKRNLLQGNKFEGLIAPAVSLAGFVAVIVLILFNYSTVTGSDAFYIQIIPVALLVMACIGYLRAHRLGDRVNALSTEPVEAP